MARMIKVIKKSDLISVTDTTPTIEPILASPASSSPLKPIDSVKKRTNNQIKKYGKHDKFRVERYDPILELERVFVNSGRTIGEIEKYYQTFGRLLNLLRKHFPSLTDKDKLDKGQIIQCILPLMEFYRTNIKDRHPGTHKAGGPNIFRKLIYTPMKG